MTRAQSAGRVRALLLLILGALAPAGFCAVTSPQELVAQGHLELDAWLTPTDTIVPGQKLVLSLQIATDRWFTGGTRISLPEVRGLVILQTEQFASNASERRADQNWVIQRWTLDVYPQRPGEFTIPPVKVRVKVSAGDTGAVEGALHSAALNFRVTLPAALADVPQWVAAPEFSVSQRFDKSLEGLQVGDAFERELVFEGSDVRAMMLPTFTPETLAGLAVYPAPPVLENSSNRGQTRAVRRQKISYVVEAEGQYQLPATDYFWWNTGRGELQVVSLPTTVFTVGTGAPVAARTIDAVLPQPRRLLQAAAGLALLAGLFWLARRSWPRLLAPAVSACRALRDLIRALRKPALPARLNPGNSAGE